MIKLLDKNTIDKIAAGEVIERPSSVVKELIENAIDSKATGITVEIKDGGISFIRVTDNGCGIEKDEVRTAFMRHATSKITGIEDLNSIFTLGFRGEALATISAVAQTELITKTPSSLTGVKYVVHGGEEIEFKEVGVPDGTTVVVRNLFYNTPARRKFLKTAMTEGSYIQDLVTKLALSHPHIATKLIVNGQTKLSTSGNGNVRDIIYQLYGRDITNALIEVSHEENSIKISGYIAKPYVCRGNRSLETYFINERYIKNNMINKALEEGYKTYVMQHKFPFCVLFFELPQESLDVNVHPTKMEFKYSDEKALFEAVLHATKLSLEQRELIAPANVVAISEHSKESKDSSHGAEPFEQGRAYEQSSGLPKPSYQSGSYSKTYKLFQELLKNDGTVNDIENSEDKSSVTYEKSISDTNEAEPKIYAEAPNTTITKPVNPKVQAYQKNAQLNMFDEKFLTPEAKVKHRIIGQLFDTYWLIEYDKNLYIMDQHAAHEKIKFEELVNNFNKAEVYSQQLMPPLIVTLTYQERETLLRYYDLFMKVGYDIEEFGGNEFKINAVPINLYGINEKATFMDMLSSLMENSGYVSNDIFIKKLATMACKSAIKGNTRISFEEADNLITQLLKLENPYTCPHGRPTIISMSEQELEKKFKRIV